MNVFFRSTHASKKVFLHLACLSVITLNAPQPAFANSFEAQNNEANYSDDQAYVQEYDQELDPDYYVYQDPNCQAPQDAPIQPQPCAKAACKPCQAEAYAQSSKISKLRPFPVVVGLLAVSILAVTLLNNHKHQHTARSRSCCNRG